VVGDRGYTLMEIVVAMAVIGLVATGVFVGEEGQLRQVSRSFEELELSRAAASRLEAMAAPEPGERAFDTGVRGARGREVVTVLEPGLFEVVVEARRGDRVVRLVTVVAAEAAR
jgi:prepilin-type N-terminal cleavage/methylation domain-containing protein